MSLVEVMVATGVASMALLALLGTAFTAYKINQKARLRDNARAVLRTYVDQFQRLAFSSESGTIRQLFSETPPGADGQPQPTGKGLVWGGLSDGIPYPDEPTVLEINIGTPGSPQTAIVTREVRFVNMTTGEVAVSRIQDAAGFMMRATFTVTYTVAGTGDSPTSQSMSTLRLIY